MELHLQILECDVINELWSRAISTKQILSKKVRCILLELLLIAFYLEIEEKQRANRRKRDEEVEQAIQKGLSYPEYSPAWFDRAQDEFTGSVVHIFKGDYWQCKSNQEWTRCPTIF